jgi:hypothetical protein
MKAQSTIATRGQIFRKTLLAFLVFGLLIGGGYWLFRGILNAPKEAGVQAPLRKMLRANEALFSKAQSPSRLAKTYPKSAAAKQVRVNGRLGLSAADTAWRLKVARGPGDTLLLSLTELRRLPKTEIVFDFKCIEGWDQVSRWGGVKMADFIKAYHLEALAQ